MSTRDDLETYRVTAVERHKDTCKKREWQTAYWQTSDIARSAKSIDSNVTNPQL